MRIEIISGSARANSQTKRLALHLYKKLQNSSEVFTGLIKLNEIALGPVENVFNLSCDAAVETRPIVDRVFKADALILVSPIRQQGRTSSTIFPGKRKRQLEL